MAELLQANWILLIVALLIGVLVAWWIFAANRKTTIEKEPGEEASGPSKRNQALIDSPPAAAGELSAAANTQKVAAAPASADAEAGPDVAPRPSPVAPEPAPAPAPAPAQATEAPRGVTGDDLTRIKGLGPKLHAQLIEMDVLTFAQIAAWDEAEVNRIDSQLGRFQGRIRRDNWVEQAKFLAAGDQAGFEGKFGKS